MQIMRFTVLLGLFLFINLVSSCGQKLIFKEFGYVIGEEQRDEEKFKSKL